MCITCLRLMLLGTLLAGAFLGAAGVSADPGTGPAVAPPAVGIVTTTVLDRRAPAVGDAAAVGAGVITLAVNLLYFPPGTALDVYVAGTGDTGELAAEDFALLGTATTDGKGGATLLGVARVAGWGTVLVWAVPAGSPALAPVAWWTGTGAA